MSKLIEGTRPTGLSEISPKKDSPTLKKGGLELVVFVPFKLDRLVGESFMVDEESVNTSFNRCPTHTCVNDSRCRPNTQSKCKTPSSKCPKRC